LQIRGQPGLHSKTLFQNKIKQNPKADLLIHATTWMNLKSVMQSGKMPDLKANIE
jgi:hypothetical protein